MSNEEAKEDIIVMNKEGDRYNFYIVDRVCLLKATLSDIRELAKYNHAKISYFPTADEAITEFRENIEISGLKELLLSKFSDIIKGN